MSGKRRQPLAAPKPDQFLLVKPSIVDNRRICPDSRVQVRWSSPYELSFTATVPVGDSSQYINPCCWGGDIIRDRLMSPLAAQYGEIRTGQEDWGWFIGSETARFVWPSIFTVTTARLARSAFA